MDSPIDIVLPVRNEAGAIGGILQEFHRVVSLENDIPIRFVVSEDGSRDNTVEALQQLREQLPIFFVPRKDRAFSAWAMADTGAADLGHRILSDSARGLRISRFDAGRPAILLPKGNGWFSGTPEKQKRLSRIDSTTVSG